MLMIGMAEIILISIIVIGALMMILSITRSRAAGKNRVQANKPAADASGANYDDIRTRVERRYRRRYELAAHMVMFLFILGGLALLRVPSTALALLGGVWALIVAVHGLQVVFAEFSDRAIEREIERERAQLYGSDKPKRDWQVRLSDEGELLDIIEDEPEADDKQKRQG